MRNFVCCLVLVLSVVPSMAATSLRGWLVGPEDPARPLPQEVRVLQKEGAWRFVELPAGAVPGMERGGLLFQPVPGAFELRFGEARIDAREGEPEVPRSWRSRTDVEGPRPYLVKFQAPVRPEWLAAMERLGARPVQYLPTFGYLLLVEGETPSALRRMDAVEFVGELHPAYRWSSELKDLAGTEQRVPVRLVLFDLPGRTAIERAVADAGGRIRRRSAVAATSQRDVLHYLVVDDFPAERLAELLSGPEVFWAERYHEPRLEGERAAQIVAGNITGGQPDADYFSWLAQIGADGSGVTVAVADSGLDTGDDATVHPDVRGRTTYATGLCPTPQDPDGHGTNVASMIAADGRATSGGTGLTDSGGFHWGGGSAPGATLFIQPVVASLCPSGVAGDPAALASNAVATGGAVLGNHSFTDGQPSGSSYTSTAQAWDAVVRDAVAGSPGNQQYLAVFSAGNSGPSASSLTSPKAAKNIVTVGATENYRPGECPDICATSADDIDVVVGFSSRGPTADGRIKPDVVAPGHVTAGMLSSFASYSCACDGGGGVGCCDSQGVDGTLQYTRYSGTSQASPRIAGASALLFDWYEGQQGTYPSPAMAKALLIHSAVDLKAPDVPNNTEGWGRPLLRNVIDAGGDLGIVDQSMILGATGDAGAYIAARYVQDPGAPVKATLVWTDPPGVVGCSPCLVNNLDLELSQGLTVWRGNNFFEGLTKAGGTNDALNNVEGILLPGDTFTCDPVSMKVRATTLGGDGVPGNADGTDQDFALVTRNLGASPGPARLAVAAQGIGGGCDGDAFLDRGETVDLSLDLANRGCSNGTGLGAQVTLLSAPPGAVIDITPIGVQSVADLVPGASAMAGWQVSLADGPSSFCGEVAVLQVDLSDGAGGSWQETVEILLDGESVTPGGLVDPVDGDLSSSADPEWSIQGCNVSSAPTSWHMGQTDCTGIVRDASQRSLVFTYDLAPADELLTLSFQHAFDGYSNSSLQDSIAVEIDHDGNGSYDVLQTWRDGVDAPASMSPAGPYDLTPFNETRGNQVSVRFRFQSAASWVGGPNNAAGWDVDDIELAYSSLTCDPATCVTCSGPPDPVPGGAPGSPLLVAPDGGGGLQVSWDAVSGAVGYNLYEGSIGGFYSHASFSDPGLDGGDSCLEPGTTVTIDMPAGNVYFLVASDSGCAESVYGFDSTGSPVPDAPVPCTP